MSETSGLILRGRHDASTMRLVGGEGVIIYSHCVCQSGQAQGAASLRMALASLLEHFLAR